MWTLPLKLDKAVYHDKGVNSATCLGDFILIPFLKIGGAIQDTDKKSSMTLDNGFVLKVLDDASSNFEELLQSARNLSRAAPADLHAALLDSHITIALQQERLDLITTWDNLCMVEARLEKLEHWAVSTFPDSSGGNWLAGAGMHVDLAGDGLTIGTCTPIYKYRIFTIRMLNNLCYFDFPVSLPHNKKTYFLHIPTRTIRLQSRRIPCQARPTKTYVTNPTNIIFSINRNGHTKIITPRTVGTYKHFQKLHLIRGFNSKITYSRPSWLDHYSVL